MSLSPEIKHALLEYGMHYDRKNKAYWSGDYYLSEVDLEGLQLFEVDQILAAMREQKSEIELSPNKTFRLK